MKIANTADNYIKTNTGVYSLRYHVIFCPKYRRPVLTDKISKRLSGLLSELQGDLGYSVLEHKIMPEHVHLLIDCHPGKNIHNVIRHIKGQTAGILRKEFPELVRRIPCLWTRSKFVATVGSVSLEVVQKYIENQKGK